MFDVGWQELALTGVVALVVLGPKELPGVMRTLGQIVRKVRLVAHDFQMNLEELADDAELEEFKRNALKNINLDPDKPLPPPVIESKPDDKPAA